MASPTVIGTNSTCPAVAHKAPCSGHLPALSRSAVPVALLTSHGPRLFTSQVSVLSAPIARLDPAHHQMLPPLRALSPHPPAPVRAAPLGATSPHHLLDPIIVIKHLKLLYLHAHLFHLPGGKHLSLRSLPCSPVSPGAYLARARGSVMTLGLAKQSDGLLTYIILTATSGGRYPRCTGEKSPEGLHHLSKAQQLIRGRAGVGWPA